MKIQSGLQEQYLNKDLTQGINKRKESAGEFGIDFLEDEVGDMQLQETKALNDVLSSGEMSTLHALFGSEKPTEFSVYGRNKLQNIHKGQLLDIKG